ncbi:MAG: hypothetical protein J0I08_22885 [Rhizobiales bacterium]|nr:hypothetical protein [Hyphomicrobiales bacterium]
MLAEFPFRLWEADHDWNIVGNTASSGVTTGGAVAIRSDGGGYWSASLNNIRFLDETYTLLWRALRQICNGGVNGVVVQRKDMSFRPWPAGVTYLVPPDVSHSDGTFFDDGTGYYQPVIYVTVHSAADLRATTLDLDLLYCGPLRGGEAFSIRHPVAGWRMYEIATVTPINSQRALVTFNPPLREAVEVGTEIEFDQPRCAMRLLDAAAMNLNTTTYPFSLASVKFIEARF